MSEFYDFTFLDKRPNDFGKNIRVKSHNIGFPSKNKVKERPAFSNMEIDFSEIYGSQTFSNRTVEYVLNVLDETQGSVEVMHDIKTQLANWLMSTNGKKPLYDDKIPGYHFLGEVESELSLEDNVKSGELTIKFECYPFMIKNDFEGSDIWDSFNFSRDVSQEVEYRVDGSINTILINSSLLPVYPKVTSDSEMTLNVNDVVFPVGIGVNTIKLQPGENYLTIEGTGKITFDWYTEVI